jgi:hypothetical protein
LKERPISVHAVGDQRRGQRVALEAGEALAVEGEGSGVARSMRPPEGRRKPLMPASLAFAHARGGHDGEDLVGGVSRSTTSQARQPPE